MILSSDSFLSVSCMSLRCLASRLRLCACSDDASVANALASGVCAHASRVSCSWEQAMTGLVTEHGVASLESPPEAPSPGSALFGFLARDRRVFTISSFPRPTLPSSSCVRSISSICRAMAATSRCSRDGLPTALSRPFRQFTRARDALRAGCFATTLPSPRPFVLVSRSLFNVW